MLKKKFGKNAVLKGTNFLEGATMRERNMQIGGHRAGVHPRQVRNMATQLTNKIGTNYG